MISFVFRRTTVAFPLREYPLRFVLNSGLVPKMYFGVFIFCAGGDIWVRVFKSLRNFLNRPALPVYREKSTSLDIVDCGANRQIDMESLTYQMPFGITGPEREGKHQLIWCLINQKLMHADLLLSRKCSPGSMTTVLNLGFDNFHATALIFEPYRAGMRRSCTENLCYFFVPFP